MNEHSSNMLHLTIYAMFSPGLGSKLSHVTITFVSRSVKPLAYAVKQKGKHGQRPTKAALPPQESEPAWQGWSNKAKAPKEFLKSANENLDDFVPSWWGFRGCPHPHPWVTATLAAVERWTSVGLVTGRLQVQTPELTRYKSVVLPLNRQLTHCS